MNGSDCNFESYTDASPISAFDYITDVRGTIFSIALPKTKVIAITGMGSPRMVKVTRDTLTAFRSSAKVDHISIDKLKPGLPVSVRAYDAENNEVLVMKF